jgi:hypothetical protein
VKEFPGDVVPEHLSRPREKNGRPFWLPECWSFHTAAWWRRHWEKTGIVAVENAELMSEGWKDWARYEHACELAGTLAFPSEEETLLEDAGRFIGLVRVVAVRTEVTP